MREARDESQVDGVADADHHDGNGPRDGPCCNGGRCRDRYHDVRLEPDQLRGEGRKPFEAALRVAIVDDKILAFEPPVFAQRLPECVEATRIGGSGRASQKADSGNPSRPRLLRLDGERRGEQGSQASDECAAVHSIT
jgi:hypothetical protein